MNGLKQRGLTLIEMMIALVISLIIISAVLTTYVSMSSSNIAFIKSTRLNQELRSVMNLLTRDVRRAGHDRNAADNLGADNPFSLAGETELSITNNGAADEIQFSYDAVDDAVIEAFAYRLNDGAIEFRQGTHDGVSAFTWTSAWQDITDIDLVEITELNFELTPNPPIILAGAEYRQLSITLTGRLQRDNDFEKSLVEVIKVRNEHFVP